MLLNVEQLPYFNKSTLGQLLGKSGENLNYWTKKLLKESDLIALKKGLYIGRQYYLSFARSPEAAEKYLEYLATIIRYPSYISLEYALSKYGAIPEAVYTLTCITTKSPRTFQTEIGTFSYRNLQPALFVGFDLIDFEEKRIKFASKAKALFDFLYFKKAASLKTGLESEFRINWNVFTPADRERFKTLVTLADSPKMNTVVQLLQW